MQGYEVIRALPIIVLLCGSCVLYQIYVYWSLALFLKILVAFVIYINATLFIYVVRLATLLALTAVKSLLRTPNKSDFFKESSHTAIVLPNDLDPNMHMNNARYQTELDYARTKFYMNCGIGQYSFRTNNTCYMTACTIRYRRALAPFQRFKIITKISYWDDDSFYYEHRFISQHKDIKDFVYCIVYAKLKVLKGTTDEYLKGFLEVNEAPERSSLSEEWELFIKFNQTSSTNLRKNKQT